MFPCWSIAIATWSVGMAGCSHAMSSALPEVPTLCLDHLTTAQARAFMIADNRLTEIATWDDRLLAEQLKDLSRLGLDFSLEVTGFMTAEIDLRIASLEDTPAKATTPPMPCLNPRRGRRSTRSAISGFSVAIGFCAGAPSILQPSPR
jgi:hypothetical protein